MNLNVNFKWTLFVVLVMYSRLYISIVCLINNDFASLLKNGVRCLVIMEVH
jgi:hypothetical protein